MNCISFLNFEGITYFARSAPRSPGEPSSSIIRLIQGIYARNPIMARRMLRCRVFSTEPPSLMDSAMVKVAAKRLTTISTETSLDASSLEVEPALPPPLHFQAFKGNGLGERGKITSHADGIQFIKAWLQTIPRSGELYERNRPVAAILVGPDGVLLGGSLNENARDRTRHAEVNLIQAWFSIHPKPLPAGARIYVTLKPCRMCAAMIWECCESRDQFSVIYDEEDPGPLAKSTCLDGTRMLSQWS